MNLEYSNKNTEILFTDLFNVSKSKNLIQKIIGFDLTKCVKRRLSQIKAAVTFKQYLSFQIGNPHSLSGNLANYYGINLNGHIRLIIQPVPVETSAEALAVCDTAKIIGIVDYHGDKNEWLIS